MGHVRDVLVAWQVLAAAAPTSLAEGQLLANQVRRRAQRHRCRVAPGLLDELLQDPRVTVGGADAALSNSAVAMPVEHVMYLKAAELDAVIDDVFIVTDPNDPNVIIYAVTGTTWRGGPTGATATAVVDLIDQGDLRSANEVIQEFR